MLCLLTLAEKCGKIDRLHTAYRIPHTAYRIPHTAYRIPHNISSHCSTHFHPHRAGAGRATTVARSGLLHSSGSASTSAFPPVFLLSHLFWNFSGHCPSMDCQIVMRASRNPGQSEDGTFGRSSGTPGQIAALPPGDEKSRKFLWRVRPGQNYVAETAVLQYLRCSSFNAGRPLGTHKSQLGVGVVSGDDTSDTQLLRAKIGFAKRGITFKPYRNRPLFVGQGVQGHIGKREGVAGSLRVNHDFWQLMN